MFLNLPMNPLGEGVKFPCYLLFTEMIETH
jgi:hypothetical protein